MAGEDFVEVQLTEHGKEVCGAGELHVIAGPHQFTFKRDERQRVTKAFDWTKVLSHQQRDGQLLFEIVTEPAAVGAGDVVVHKFQV
jgi:hypothetical protein